MKNKFKITLALLLCLALVIVIGVGCTTTKYNLSIKKGEMSLSDIAEKALPSCVLVDTVVLSSLGNPGGHYQCVGLAITESSVLIARQAVPEAFIGTNRAAHIINVNGEDEIADLQTTPSLEEEGSDYGIAVLKLKDENVKLTPAEFSDSDLLKVGDILMGVDLIPPLAMQGNAPSPFRVFEAMTSALSMRAETISVPTNFKEGIKQNAFTINGNLLKSRPVYDHKLSEMTGINFELCSAFLFDSKGKFVGLNCAKVVGAGKDNADVVYGVGYATRANVIKKQLEDKEYI